MSEPFASLLFGAVALDPVTYATIIRTAGASTLAANYFPARRATKVDPLIALRAE